MSTLKSLAKQTLFYGLTNMVGRFINFALIPLYTRNFNPETFGVVNYLLAFVTFLIVILTYGMETAFFNFTRKSDDTRSIYKTAFSTLLISTSIFLILGCITYPYLAKLIDLYDVAWYVLTVIIVLALDTISALPFALLRLQEKPLKFASIKLANILINVGANLYFIVLCPYLLSKGYDAPFYKVSIGIGYIFISFLLASFFTVLLLYKEILMGIGKIDTVLQKQMLKYGYPLIWVGLAGMANETIDRILLKKMAVSANALFEIGIYSAFYKLSMIMTIFVQGFRFAAEPFFFKQSSKNNNLIYANVMHYFVAFCSLIFLVNMLFINELSILFIKNNDYFTHPDGLKVVPILLMANLFLGINYNVSIWYKIKEKNKLGARISIVFAILTLILNIIFIPIYGFISCAWITLIIYLGMAISNYFIGKKYMNVPYSISFVLFSLLMAVLGYKLYLLTFDRIPLPIIIQKIIIIIAFITLIYNRLHRLAHESQNNQSIN